MDSAPSLPPHFAGVDFEALAQTHGTPFFLYDLGRVRERIRQVRAAFGPHVSLLYAMKANPNLELLRALRPLVDGLDVSSDGEVEQALLAGYPAASLSYAGPAKSAQHLQSALREGVGLISVESTRELDLLVETARALKLRPRILLRINPTEAPKGFAIKMGGRATQFGIDEPEIHAVAARLAKVSDAVEVKGIHVYAGTQSLDADAIADGVAYTLKLARTLEREHGVRADVVNLGGGLGVSYTEAPSTLDLNRLGQRLEAVLAQARADRPEPAQWKVELGRFLVADAGIYVSRVIGEKRSRDQSYLVLDGGMNHHLAASGHLGATLRQNFVFRNLSRPAAAKDRYQVVGPLCTPIDLLGHQLALEESHPGDLVAVLNSGSYAYTASPLLFLGHQTPAELLLDEGQVRLARRRFRISDFN